MSATVELVDGRHGLRLTPSPAWSLLLACERSASWEVAPSLGLTIRFWPEPCVVDPFLLEDFRHDLRQLAAERGGGLISCELRRELGAVEAITKEPQRRVGRGHSYRGFLLVPLESGRAEIELVAHEGETTGWREMGFLARALEDDHPRAWRPPRWQSDPYGFDPPPAPTGPLPSWRWPIDLTRAAPSDEPAEDARYPSHPLSRVRELLADLPLEVTRPSNLRVPRGRTEAAGARFFCPLGFGALSHEASFGQGTGFARVSFEGARHELWLARHPLELEALREDTELARRLVSRSASDLALTLGPRPRWRVWGERAGLLVDYEGRDEQEGQRYGAAFLTEHAGEVLELHRRGPRTDWLRARSDLRGLVASLDPTDEVRASEAIPRVSANGRRRVYRLLCWVAWSDGEFAPSEARLLASWRERLGLGAAEAQELVEQASRGESLRVGRRGAERELLIEGVVEIAAADGVFDPSEQRHLERLAQQLGFDSAVLLSLVREAL